MNGPACARVRSLGAVSHAIRLSELSTVSTNVAIPTMWMCGATQCRGNCMRHSWIAHPMGVMRRHRWRSRRRRWRHTRGLARHRRRWRPAPDAECPQATRSSAHRARGGAHAPTVKRAPSTGTFPHQQAETSQHNQHAMSFRRRRRPDRARPSAAPNDYWAVMSSFVAA